MTGISFFRLSCVLRPRYKRELKAYGPSYQSGRGQRLFKERLGRYRIAVRSGRPSEEESKRSLTVLIPYAVVSVASSNALTILARLLDKWSWSTLIKLITKLFESVEKQKRTEI